jgi:protein-tyrosine-phosphatase
MSPPPACAKASSTRSRSRPWRRSGSKHKPVTFEELDEWEGLNFDLIITLAPEAHHRALELTRTSGVDVEYWPTGDPTVTEGSREQRLDTYREIRDQLLGRIRQRFSRPSPGNE